MAKITVSPPPFNGSDLEGTVKKLCEYSTKLAEELQWALNQLEKKIGK